MELKARWPALLYTRKELLDYVLISNTTHPISVFIDLSIQSALSMQIRRDLTPEPKE